MCCGVISTLQEKQEILEYPMADSDSDKDKNPNLEWKKSGFETNDKITLKVNVAESIKYDVKKKNNIQKNFTPRPADLPVGLSKLRKKIKDVFDEDEDDENEVPSFTIAAMDESSSLMNALNDTEKSILKQHETNNSMRMQQNAGKLEAITIAQQFAKETGMKPNKMESLANGMQSIGSGDDVLNKIIVEDFGKKLNIKGKDLPDGKAIQLLRGIKRIRAVGGNDAVKGLKISEVVNAGEKETDEKKVAKLIQQKRGLDKNEQKRLEKAKGKSKNKNNSKILTQKPSLRRDLFRD